VLLEGGAALATSWLRAGVIDRIALFVAPTVIGAGGLAWPGPLARAWAGQVASVGRVGRDVCCMVEMEG